MDFGRLPDISHVDFSMPPDRAENSALLARKSRGEPFRLFTGCPVWGEKEWLGMIYPKEAKERELLFHYAKQFNSIELNTTYYRVPSPATVNAWKNATPEHFRFCPKIPQEISHTRMLSGTADLAFAFYEALEPLGERLGNFFLQLPPWFGPGQSEALKKFIADFPEPAKLSVEFRNEDWFAHPQPLNGIFAFLEERGAGTVITDTAGRRDALHLRLTNTTAFIRFTANDLHPTDYPRMDTWAQRLREWKNEGLETAYFFVHSPTHGKMPLLVDYATKKCNGSLGTSLAGCRFITEQQSLFD